MNREEFEALPGFVRWATPAEVEADWFVTDAQPGATWAWFQPPYGGWRLPTDDERGRRCSAMRCASTDIVAVIVRDRNVTDRYTRVRKRATSTRVHCAPHTASYGVYVVDGRLLWMRWWAA